MVQIAIPKYVRDIIDTLQDAGFEACIVGGCVRDALLSRTPSDWDVTTSATPDQIMRTFPRTVPTGVEHGTVTVLAGKRKAEVTTYRVDGAYEDFRHPKKVRFTASLGEDLKRRDFTINAMAYNDRDGLIDLFGGEKDLKARKVRAVGNASERFGEDALRIMRAFRFAAQLSFDVEEETLSAARMLSANLQKISAERIRDELVKLICSDNPAMLIQMYHAGVTKQFLPEFDRCMETPQNNPYHCYDVGTHTVVSMEGVRKERVLRLTMLLHDVAKPDTRTTDPDGIDHFFMHPERGAEMARDIFRRLRLDNATISRCCKLIRWHDAFIGSDISDERIRRVMHEVGRKDMPLLFEVMQADDSAKERSKMAEKEKRLQRIRERYAEIECRKDPVALKELAVNGSDLIEKGIGTGREIGMILSAMLDDVIRDPACNTRAYLLSGKQLAQYRERVWQTAPKKKGEKA